MHNLYAFHRHFISFLRPKWMAIQAVHMFIETVVVDHSKYLVPYSNRIQMVNYMYKINTNIIIITIAVYITNWGLYQKEYVKKN